MRKEVQEYVFADEERRRFIREQPVWYRKLSRNPNDLSAFHLDMMNFMKKRFLTGSTSYRAAFRWPR